MEEVNCPVDNCEDCEFNRSQSWCARALPDYKGHTELEKIRMEGFWEAIDWCEEHYKWMEEHWEQLDAYTGLVIKILEECYADGRPPTEADMFMIDTFWNGEEQWKIGIVIGLVKERKKLMVNIFQKYFVTSMDFLLLASYVSLAADMCGEIRLMIT